MTTQSMRLSILIGADASGATAGAAQAEQALNKIRTTAAAAGQTIQQMLTTQQGLSRAAAETNLSTTNIRAYGAQLDALRAKYNPLYAAISQYKAAVVAIRQAHAAGAISATEMAAAISRERQATLASTDAIRGRNTALGARPASGAQGFQTSNIAAQFQDIGVTSAMGMSPLQIALQQGTQLSAVFATMQNPIRGIGAAIATVFSPVSLITIAVVAAAAFTIQWFMNAKKAAKSFDDVLSDHRDTLETLKGVYGDLAAAQAKYAMGGKTFADASARTDAVALQKEAKNQQLALLAQMSPTTSLKPLTNLSGMQLQFKDDIAAFLARVKDGNPDLDKFNAAIDATVSKLMGKTGSDMLLKDTGDDLKGLADDVLAVKGEFEAFSDPINKFKAEMAAGGGDLAAFSQSVDAIGRSKGIEVQASKLITFGAKLLEVTQRFKEAEKLQSRVFGDRAPGGLLLSHGPSNIADMGNYDQYQKAQAIEAERAQKAFDAQQQQAAARTTAEKIAAAKAVAEAQYPSGEDLPDRKQRIGLAEKGAALNAERELKQAQEDRVRSADAIVAAARFELSIAGQSLGVQVIKKAEFEAEAQYREQIARSGAEFNKDDLDALRQKAALAAEFKQQLAAQNAIRQGEDGIARQRLEVSLAAASTAERAKALALFDAELKIRDLGIKAGSKDAELTRQQAVEQVKLNKLLELQNAIRLQTVNNDRLRQEVSLTGATTSERAKQLALFDAEQKIKELGYATSSKEAAIIRQQALETAGLNQLLTAGNAIRQGSDDLTRLEKEVSLAKATTAEREKQLALFDAEQKIRELGLATTSQEAQLLRQQAADRVALNQQLAGAKFDQGQKDELDKLRLQASLIGATAQQQARANAVFEAENDMRRQGLDLLGQEADRRRAVAVQQADQRLEIERQTAAYQSLQQAEGAAIDAAVTGTGTWKERLKSMADSALQWFEQIAVANPLKNMLTNTNLPTLSDLFSGKSASPVGATTTGSMTVNAATVMINGAPIGVPGASAIGGLVGANTNGVRPEVIGGNLINSPVTAATAQGTDVQSQVWNYWASKGLQPHQIAGIMGNMSAESAFQPNAVGDAGKALGLAQWNDRGPAMQAAVPNWQTNVPGQLDFMNHEFQTTENASWQRLLASKDVTSATAAAAGFERPRGFSVANPQGADNWSGRVDGANLAMQKFGQTATATSSEIDKMGTGAIDASKALTDGNTSLVSSIAKASQTAAQPAAPGLPAGGSAIGGAAPTAGILSSLTGVFGSLFKGISGIFGSLFKGVGSIFGSLLGGLFAKGGAFSGGNVVPFATGGVVSTPTLFPMAGGRAGVMGEAGPEAIMPLHRGPGGKLGVAMAMPRAVRQGGEMKLNMSSSNTLVIQGTSDAERELQFRRGTEAMLDQRDRQWRDALPGLIEQYRKDPHFRMSS